MPTEYHKAYEVDFNERKMMKISGKSTKSDNELKFHSIKRRKCYFKGEKVLKFFNTYTKGNCEVECLANFTLKVKNKF